MKNLLFALFAVGFILTSCGDAGTKTEAKDAEKVEVKKEATTMTFATVDAASYIDWWAAHLGGVEPRFGKVFLKSAEVLVNDGKLSNAKVVADMTNFTVENFEDEESKNKLTGHLQSGDFFNVEAYPTATFEMTKLEAATGEYNSMLTGNLTILDQTKSISFKANVNVAADKVSVQSEKFAVDRREWGLVYNVEGTAGVPADYIIANDISFTINATVSK